MKKLLTSIICMLLLLSSCQENRTAPPVTQQLAAEQFWDTNNPVLPKFKIVEGWSTDRGQGSYKILFPLVDIKGEVQNIECTFTTDTIRVKNKTKMHLIHDWHASGYSNKLLASSVISFYVDKYAIRITSMLQDSFRQENFRRDTKATQ